MKTTLDLPDDLVRAVKMRAVAEDRKLKDMVADFHLSEVIVRELILKVHPKLVDHLVNQAMTSTPNVEAEEATREEEHEERPRRRRREE